MTKYSVTDVANILGLTSSAVRFYEKENLMTVNKDAQGHRYYDIGDVFLLLSYTKYRNMGLSLKTVVKQFSGVENDRKLIIQRLEERKKAVEEEVVHLQLLAKAIDEHLNSAHRIDALLDRYEFDKCPSHFILYDEEDGWISKNRRAQKVAQRWVKAMPFTRLAVLLPDGAPQGAVFGYSIQPDMAEKLHLPKDLHVQKIERSSCLHSIRATNNDFPYNPGIVFQEPLAFAKKHGLTVSGPPWGHILLVETAPALLRPYVEVWIPISLHP